MSELRIHVTKARAEQLTVDEQIAIQESVLEDGTPRLRDLVSAIARLSADESGKYLEYDNARRQLGKMTSAELGQIGQAISEAMKDDAVPPENTTAS